MPSRNHDHTMLGGISIRLGGREKVHANLKNLLEGSRG